MSGALYTVGHSSHAADAFLVLLRQHQVTAVADVRSSPYSRFAPQFNLEALRSNLADAGLKYVFLGAELGGRPADPACYVRGRLSYERMAEANWFKSGLERIAHGMRHHRVALLCAEKDPLACHRGILIGRELLKRGLIAQHILENGSLESQPEAAARLRVEMGLPRTDLFRGEEEMLSEAYRRRGEQIAYSGTAPQTVPLEEAGR